MNHGEIDYLRQRADEEAAAALSASDRSIARIHDNLAALYNRKIVEMSFAERQEAD